MDDAHPIDDAPSDSPSDSPSDTPSAQEPSVPQPGETAPSRHVWLTRGRHGARFVAVRSVRLARKLRESFRRHTAWTVASITGTLGVLLMAILQLLYVLPSSAAPDPQSDQADKIVQGPRDPSEMLPLIVSANTAPAASVAPIADERTVPEPLQQPQPTLADPAFDPPSESPPAPLTDGDFGSSGDYEVVPTRKPRPVALPGENPENPFGPPTTLEGNREPIAAELQPEPLPTPADPVTPPASEPVDPLDRLYFGDSPSSPAENPFAPPSSEPTSEPPLELTDEPLPRPKPELILQPEPEPIELPPAIAEEPPLSPEPEPITAPPAISPTAPPTTSNPPVADDPFGPDPLDNLFTPKPNVEPQRTGPPLTLTAPPAAEPALDEPSLEPPPLELTPMEAPPVDALPWPEPPVREAPPALEPPPAADPPDFDPLDALFGGPLKPRPRPEPLPEPEQDARRPVGAAAPIAVDVLVLPPDDNEAFHAESSPRRAEPAAQKQRAGEPWSMRTEHDRVEVPRPYRERLTPALREQIERDRGQAPRTSPVPAEKPSVRQLDVIIEKHGPKIVAADVPAKFEIVVRNGGRTLIECVDVDEPVPPTHEVLDVDPPALFDHDTLRWRLHDLKAGESRTLTMVLIPTGRGTIETTTTANVASTISASVDVVPADSASPDVVADNALVTTPPNEPPAEPSVSPIDPISQPQPAPVAVQSARLRLDVMIPERVRVGAACPIVFRVTNEGGTPAQGVRLCEFLPDGLTHPLGDRLEYIVGSLPPGTTKEARLTVTAAGLGTFVNEAVLQIAGNAAEPVTTSVTVYEPGFRLRREGWREITAGQPVEFTNHVENVAGRDLTGLLIEEAVPEGVEVVRVDDGGRYDAERGTIIWQIDRLAADQTITLGVTLRATTPGPFRTEVYGEATDQAAMPIAAHVTAVRRGRP